MERNLTSIVENNVKFIQQYSFDEWVSKLKLVAIACISFPSSAEIEEIMNTKNYSVRYDEWGISEITIIANGSEWNSVEIKLNCICILISRQEGHSRFEPVSTIPLEIIRMFSE
jgi:hypothetical protein|nr:MAG TPA: hypothetical protein [Caudoviricetes sp.]